MEEVQPVVKQSSTKATRKMKFEMFQEQDRLSRLSATSGQEMVELRKKSIAPDQISLSKNPLHPPSSLMNSSNNNNDLNSFMTIKISNNNIPEMHIMNEFDEEHDAELLVDIMQMEILTADE